MVWSTYKEKVKYLSTLLVEAQKPIRILDAIKWPSSVEEALRKSKYKEMPELGPEYYEKIDLGFEPGKKIEEFESLQSEVRSQLGEGDELGRLMIETCAEYQDVVRMLQARGTPDFHKFGKVLYGSPKDVFWDGSTKIQQVARSMYGIFSMLGDQISRDDLIKDIDATKAVEILGERFDRYFGDGTVHARLSDGIVADSSAGGDVVKIRESAKFSTRDLNVLEVHEGWVHVGTTLNGVNQHVATFLAKGPPRVAATQEGLAVLMEVFSFVSYPKRARTINDRVLGIDKAEDGANFLELLEFYRTEGYDEQDCFNNAKRVFRGGVLDGGAPFTKDIAYIKGFIENYNFMRAAMREGRPEYLQFLFVGKVSVLDIPLLYQKYVEGLIDPPKHLPPLFKDLNGVAVWMSFSNVFNMIDMAKVQEHFKQVFRRVGA